MDDAKKDLYWAIFFLLALAIVWYFTGGPSRPASKSGPFLFQPQQQYSQQSQKQMEQITSGSAATTSPYQSKVNLETVYGTRNQDPKQQYLEIIASSQNGKPIDITGLALAGKNGFNIKIGQATYLPYSAQVNPQEDIFLKPGEKAYVITGESPIGASFRLNKCTGYFSQFQTFYPDLLQDCPRPINENLPSGLNDDCLDYLERLPVCRMQISVPPGLQNACQTYINEKINYNACVETHKNDSDFYKPEWRIYLNRKEPLWKSQRETIILQDQNGGIIDWVSY